MDLDTTRGKNSYDRMFQAFGAGEADILLGTQMVAKGLDFPNVTLVGVISADIGLSFPDFRAAERVFQLMMQVAGRSGRSSKKGEVIIQSSNVTHYAIHLAREHDFKSFYQQEIRYRQHLGYPPFNRLLKILVVADSLNETLSVIRTISSSIKRHIQDKAVIIGPAPDMYPKLNNLYRWQVNIKMAAHDQSVRQTIKSALSKILDPYISKPKKHVQVYADVDPFSM
jgi:primosomal protein N' (replication factor Y)